MASPRPSRESYTCRSYGTSIPSRATEAGAAGVAAPRHRYPDPVDLGDVDAMHRLLPDRPKEAILLWLAGEGPDPWDESSA
jgi:hypothetical protein